MNPQETNLISVPRLIARLSYYGGLQCWFAYLAFATWSKHEYWLLSLSLALTILWSWLLKGVLDKWRTP